MLGWVMGGRDEAAQRAPGDAKEFGIKVRCSPAGEEETLIVYDREARRLDLGGERSSLSEDARREVQGGSFDLAAGETLKLHIFLDRSMVEVFANGWACVTSRIYPSRADSLALGVFARGGRVRAKSIVVWKMRSIWAD